MPFLQANTSICPQPSQNTDMSVSGNWVYPQLEPFNRENEH